jgi:LmbE family N-acetylglucosaminyl deacetylase
MSTLRFSQSQADVFVPDEGDPVAALRRVTHLAIGAHQDDLEIFAYAGICDCLDDPARRAFGGVVVTNGAGSSRIGPYANHTDEQMQAVRRDEQREAARLGSYAIQLQLAHPSAVVKQPGHAGLAADLSTILAGCTPEVVYLHQPVDKHDTHVALFLRCLEALRTLPPERRPRRVLGGEVWRDLDWMVDADKVALDSGRRPELAERLLKVFDSQISGGKRYDLATLGRRLAHATYHQSHASDATTGLTWAMDLTPLVQDATLDVTAYTVAYLDRLQADVAARLKRFA